jgi:hypothetical protein
LNIASLSVLASFFVLLFSSCQKKEEDSFFKLMGGHESGILFNNMLIENDSINVLEFMNIYTGGGVATADVNNDGLSDLYFSGNMVSSRLYINKSTKDKIQFEDITEKAGVQTDYWATGVNMVDINQDGLMDIYVCASGSKKSTDKKNKLYINQGIKNGLPSFKELSADYGLDDSSYTTQAAFFDYDNDGDLDVFLVVNHAENFRSNTLNVPLKLAKELDINRSPRLYKNLSVEKENNEVDAAEKLFIDISLEAGIKDIGYGLGIAISDVNNDGWPDVYIACDFLSNDMMFINNQDGTFSNKISDYFKYTSYAGMGVDISDINNDGKTDIGVVDMTPEENVRLKSMRQQPSYFRIFNEKKNGYSPQFSRNTLQLNNGDNLKGSISFSEIAQLAGVHHTDWSWSSLFADFDNDGHKDFFISNGFRRDLQDLDFIKYSIHSKDDQELLKKIHELPGVKVMNYIFKNKGDLRFIDKTMDWGLSQGSYSNGAIYVDLDNDGDLDIVVNNIDDNAFVYKNTSSENKNRNHFLKFTFAGPKYNKNGLGARVEIYTEDGFQLYENNPTRGFQSCVNSTINAGIGQQKKAKKIKVVWPDGAQQVLTNISADTSIIFNYKNAETAAIKQAPFLASSLFKENHVKIQYRDQELDHLDFNYQRTIPFRVSQSGPGISVGDINGDEREDFFIGGSTNHPGFIFEQDHQGHLSGRQLHSNGEFEDIGSIMFDADGDGDLDLYVVSGSVEQAISSSAYQDRLYINDGMGNFTLAEGTLPTFLSSGSCVVAADFDQDGDMDLFVGGRVTPGKYPLPTSSKLLINESKGKDKPYFVDATEELLPRLNNIGMVTAALWTDYNNDSWMDLMIVGDGMDIMFFENKDGQFSKEPIQIENSSGYWNSIVATDFDLDGDIDYVIGNLGQNSSLKATINEPLNIYAKDVDANGTLDPVLFHYIKGVNVPFHTRDEMIEQVFMWRGLFPTYQKYAAVTFQDFASNNMLKDAYHLRYDNLSTSYLENKSDGNFGLIAMPVEAQFAPVYGMVAADFDQDGIPDVLMAGNSYAANFYIGWMGASNGKLFKGKGDGTFEAVSHLVSGFYVDVEADADVKSMVELISDGRLNILVTTTGDSLKVFQQTKDDFLMLPLELNDAFAEIIFKDGTQERREFYYGSGYLSQSSRHLKMSDPDQMSAIKIYDFQGNVREINLSLINKR